MILFKKTCTHCFDGEIEPPKVAGVLIFRIGFIRLVDDSKMDPMRVGCFDTGQIEELERNGFKHAVFAAMAVLALLNTGTEVQLAPVDIVRLVVVVAGLEVVSFVELE